MQFAARPTPPLPASLRHLPVAHRALHDRARGIIENSPSAIEAAISAGYAIEIDLQLSADGVAMVFHDDELDRLTERTGPVRNHTAAALGQIRLKDSTDHIPSFAEVLKQVAARAPLLIEIKDQTGDLSPSDGRLEAAVAADLAGYSGDLALMSFNPSCIQHLARLAPHLPRGLTTSAYDPAEWSPVPAATCARLRDIPDYAATGASFISHEAGDLARPRVAALKTEGAAVLCWTIRSAEAEAKARHYADNITFEGYAARLPA